jgi:hypothetical protein
MAYGFLSMEYGSVLFSMIISRYIMESLFSLETLDLKFGLCYWKKATQKLLEAIKRFKKDCRE